MVCYFSRHARNATSIRGPTRVVMSSSAPFIFTKRRDGVGSGVKTTVNSS